MKNILVFSTIMLVLSGCATIFKGSSQSVSFNSEPEGADIIIDGMSMGQTPATLSLKKNKYKNVMFKKDGYSTQTMALDTSYDAIALLNVFWDLSTTDLITGNAYEYAPNTYFARLRKKEGSQEESTPAPKKSQSR
jgi:uncharacterized protein YceK